MKPANRAELSAQMLSAIKKNLEVDASEATSVRDLGDSLDVMELFMQLEDTYKVKVETDNLKTVGDLVSNVAEQLQLK